MGDIHIHVHDGSVSASSPKTRAKRSTTKTTSSPAKKTRIRKKDPKMAKALKEANVKAKKKNGDFKKGWDQSRLMSEAHRLKRKL